MTSSSYIATLIAAFAIANGAMVSGQGQDDQLFTTSVPIATVTVHVGASASDAPATDSVVIPPSLIKYGVEAAAIQWANYRIAGTSHEDAVKIARDGINLYINQPAIKKLMTETYSFAVNTYPAFMNGTWTPTPEFNLATVKAFYNANQEMMAGSDFSDLNNYLTENLKIFDLGAGISDIQRLVQTNPLLAQKAVTKIQANLNENKDNEKATNTVFEMASDFGRKYNVDVDAAKAGIGSVFRMIF